MAPYLETVTSFADVPVTDDGVDTLAFLSASEGVVGLFDLLGSTAFAMVQADLKGNITLAEKRTAEQIGGARAAFAKSYEVTLKKFHNFVVKGVFSVALKACPYRADFFAKLRADPAGGVEVAQAKLDDDLDRWLAALDAIVARVQAFYVEGGYDKGL
ncbi:hypothetical protein EWM64_g2037 [Hericium alpestre]|uniref:Glycolipid transfer protein domain-containing protein n=1 Tax=Hericium alpestre TaxID=135208 RepID=A0A4Z0A4K9_9AGAM|nr:hypothetical protein EWM64_g2037 [Hericium alpestre]